MNRNTEEILTGILIGLLFGLFLFHKLAFGATVNNPEGAEKERASQYLKDEGVEIPEEVEFWCEYYGERYGICPETLEAVCWVESRCTPSAQDSTKSCKGLMQIKPSCHKERMARLNALNVFGIPENIKIGTDYLSELGGSNDIAIALTMYNGQSEAKVEEAKKGNLSKYVKKVLEISEALERVHNK